MEEKGIIGSESEQEHWEIDYHAITSRLKDKKLVTQQVWKQPNNPLVSADGVVQQDIQILQYFGNELLMNQSRNHKQNNKKQDKSLYQKLKTSVSPDNNLSLKIKRHATRRGQIARLKHRLKIKPKLSSNLQMEALYRQILNQRGPKIIGMANNYTNPALANPTQGLPETPISFLKSPSSIITEGQDIIIPPNTQINHQVQLGVLIGQEVKNVNEEQAKNAIGGYFLALDMTATWMGDCRRNGLSWYIPKGYDTFLPLSGFIEKEVIPDHYDVELELQVNGEIRQKAFTSDMFYKIEHQISFFSKYFTLRPGDMILTGTPPGIRTVNTGERIDAFMRRGGEEIMKISFMVRQ